MAATLLDTIETYEAQILELVDKARTPVAGYVAKGVERVEGRLPELTYPAGVPTPIEVVESQARFAKQLIDANAAVVTAVLEAIAPVAGFTAKKKAAKTTKSTKATAKAA